MPRSTLTSRDPLAPAPVATGSARATAAAVVEDEEAALARRSNIGKTVIALWEMGVAGWLGRLAA